MIDLSSKSLGVWAGIGTAAFLGYCIYFDHKRRSAPDFKEKLRARRRLTNQSKSSAGSTNLPNFSDQEAVQRFFLQEVQLGEELLSQGDIENGVEHLSMAVAVCGQPHSLLGVLDKQAGDETLGLLRDVIPVTRWEVKVTILFKNSMDAELFYFRDIYIP